MKHNTINELVAAFTESVLKQNEAIRRRDPSTGNKFADRYADAFKKLHAIGNSGLAAVASLLDDRRVEVRTLAAAFLVPYMTDEAVEVLEEAAEGKGIVALGAEMALKRWREEGKGIEFD
jgi:hypothetical protein